MSITPEVFFELDLANQAERVEAFWTNIQFGFINSDNFEEVKALAIRIIEDPGSSERQKKNAGAFAVVYKLIVKDQADEKPAPREKT